MICFLISTGEEIGKGTSMSLVKAADYAKNKICIISLLGKTGGELNKA